MPSNVQEFVDEQWIRGVNSMSDPISLPRGFVQWSENTVCRGGVYQTRPGLNVLPKSSNSPVPRGITVFQPQDKDPHLVAAFGGRVRALSYPFNGNWFTIASAWTNDPSDTPIVFETAMKGAITNSDGTLEIIDPYPVLIMQSGVSHPLYWDGRIVGLLNPANNQTPTGTWMKWIGNRLWVATGNKLRVSNILDPFTFTEEDIVAEGGFFVLPDECTGLGVTADQKSLLAFTSTTTTAFQAGIRERNTWSSTPDFQKVILSNIGCVAGNTIVSQYGILWWLSQGGLTRLDAALQAYRTSKLRYIDNNMARSKANLHQDLSRACAGFYENFLVLSVPSGDLYNAHTWVMDQTALELLDESANPIWCSVWKGVRPVQWVTANIKGQSRCFLVSNDYKYPLAAALTETNVWEAFIGAKKDFGRNSASILKTKEIGCSLELRYMGAEDDKYKNFDYIALDLAQLSGNIHLEIYYASRHSGYKNVLSKDIVATTNSLTVGVNISEVDTYIRQNRTVATYENTSESSDPDAGVESKQIKNTDKAFAILIKWTGEMAISRVKLCTTPGEYHIETEENETTQRYVKPDGDEAILGTLPIEPTIFHNRTSSRLLPISPRWEEEQYSSLE